MRSITTDLDAVCGTYCVSPIHHLVSISSSLSQFTIKNVAKQFLPGFVNQFKLEKLNSVFNLALTATN